MRVPPVLPKMADWEVLTSGFDDDVSASSAHNMSTAQRFQQCFGDYFGYQQTHPLSHQLRPQCVLSLAKGPDWVLVICRRYCIVISVTPYNLDRHGLLKHSRCLEGWNDPKFAKVHELDEFDDLLALVKENSHMDLPTVLNKFASGLLAEDQKIVDRMKWSDERLVEHGVSVGMVPVNVNHYKDGTLGKLQYIKLLNFKESQKFVSS